MAQQVLSFPFRIDHVNRRFGTVVDSTDTFKAEQVKCFLRTYKLEREMFPEFGIEDPVFSEFDVSQFSEDFSEFYSNIRLAGIETSSSQGVITDIIVEFE